MGRECAVLKINSNVCGDRGDLASATIALSCTVNLGAS